MTTLYDALVRLLQYTACLLIFLMVLYITASIFLRHSGFGWVLEAAEYSLVLITLFGTGWAMRAGSHIRVELWAASLSVRAQNMYNGIVYSITALLCLVFGMVGTLAARDAFLQGVLQVKIYSFPKWILLGMIPLGVFCLIVESVKLAYKYFTGKVRYV